MIGVTSEDYRRRMIVGCAIDCENALWRERSATRLPTLRERYIKIADERAYAEAMAECAMSWALAEVIA